MRAGELERIGALEHLQSSLRELGGLVVVTCKRALAGPLRPEAPEVGGGGAGAEQAFSLREVRLGGLVVSVVEQDLAAGDMGAGQLPRVLGRLEEPDGAVDLPQRR